MYLQLQAEGRLCSTSCSVPHSPFHKCMRGAAPAAQAAISGRAQVSTEPVVPPAQLGASWLAGSGPWGSSHGGSSHGGSTPPSPDPHALAAHFSPGPAAKLWLLPQARRAGGAEQRSHSSRGSCDVSCHGTNPNTQQVLEQSACRPGDIGPPASDLLFHGLHTAERCVAHQPSSTAAVSGGKGGNHSRSSRRSGSGSA